MTVKIRHSGKRCKHSVCFQCGSIEFVVGAAIGFMTAVMMIRLFW